jgi:hypothetical protein
MGTPITTLVKQRKSSKFPVNQEVTQNADGTGGPINLSPSKKIGPQGLGVKGNNGYHIGSPATKKDACYHKAKAKYDVFPSAYASGYIAKCRKKKGNIG